MSRRGRDRAPSPDDRRFRPRCSGRLGEDLAAAFLRGNGHRIVARNLRAAGAEIDLLIRKRRAWAAVEVKTRRDHPAPEKMVDAERKERLRRALRALAPHLRPRPRTLRIDVVAVILAPGREPELRHFPGVDQPWESYHLGRFWRRRLWTI